MVITRTIRLEANPLENEYHVHIIDITHEVQELVAGTDIRNGTVTVFVPGSTAAISTIEYEPGLLSDFQDMWERNVPENIIYNHKFQGSENNGYSHVRASLLGPSLVVPFADRRLILSSYQQVVLVDFDNRPRSRQVILQIMGE
ncbi:secondary thiamine-phosphate synthase enzyme YjbQ [Chloroflexota bacterium]